MVAVCYQLVKASSLMINSAFISFCSFTCPLVPSTKATPFVKSGWRTEDALSESGLIRARFGSRGLYQQALSCCQNQPKAEQEGQALCRDRALPERLLPSACGAAGTGAGTKAAARPGASPG